MANKCNWTIKEANAWMADHGKNISGYYEGMEASTLDNLKNISLTTEGIENEIKNIAEEGKQKSFQATEEQSKGFSLDEVYEIVKESKELKAKLEEIELKAGAVLNRTNKQDLKDAQAKIQKVLDSAETAEPIEEGKDIEIEDDGLDIEEKETEKESDALDIDEKELVEIIHSALESHINKSVENVSKNIKQDIDDNFKRLTGKVM